MARAAAKEPENNPTFPVPGVAPMRLDSPRIEVVTITPAIARAWLGHNSRNRSVKTARVAQYARDMRNGRWQFTGDAIRFSVDGILLDGQNRLHACIEAATPFVTTVIYGLPDATQEVMDSGAIRLSRDAVTLKGYANAQGLAAVAGTHAWYVYGFFKNAMHAPAGKDRLTNTEILEHIKEFPELEDATRIANTIQRSLPLTIGSIGTAVHEVTNVDAGAADEFISRIVNYQTEGAGDPINTLLRRVALMRERRERMLASTALYLIFRCWNAWRSGENISRYLLGSEERGWAKIPEPK